MWRFSSIPVTTSENVAEHLAWVSLYAAMIHNNVNPSDHSGLTACLMDALIHDVPECRMGDLVRTFKYSDPRIKELCDEAEEKIVNGFPPVVKELFQLSDKLSEGREPYVKAVVKAADFLSLFQYMRREATKSNLEIIPFFNHMISDLNQMTKSNEGKVIHNFDVESFYYELWQASLSIRNDCFRGLEENERWDREV